MEVKVRITCPVCQGTGVANHFACSNCYDWQLLRPTGSVEEWVSLEKLVKELKRIDSLVLVG